MLHSRQIAIVLVLACGLSACQSSPTIVRQPVELASPKEGASLMYLFRPELDRVRRSDQPTLLMNDLAVAKLGYATYTLVSLQPGRHRMRLMPSATDSASWTTEVEFEVQAGQIHFVAIWNQNQPGRGAVVPIPVARLLFFVRTGGSVSGEQSVRFEQVDRDIGVSALEGLRHVQPQVDNLAPLQ